MLKFFQGHERAGHAGKIPFGAWEAELFLFSGFFKRPVWYHGIKTENFLETDKGTGGRRRGKHELLLWGDDDRHGGNPAPGIDIGP
jgi:hypothetical protein